MLRPIPTILFFPLSLAFVMLISAGKPVFKSGLKQPHPSYRVSQVKVIKAEFPGPGNALGAYLHNNVLIPEIAFKMKGKNEVVMGGSIEVEIKADGSARFIQLKNFKVLPNTPAVVEAVKNEFRRVVEIMPRWTPAMRDGKPYASTEIIQYITGGYAHTTYEEYKQLKEQEKSQKRKSTLSFSGLKTKDGSTVYSFVQTPPKFPGGDKALQAYLLNNLTYLQESQANKKGQTIVLGIIINKKGIAEDIVVTQPWKDPGFDHYQAQEAIKSMPKWKPGKQGKTPIAVSYTFPFSF